MYLHTVQMTQSSPTSRANLCFYLMICYGASSSLFQGSPFETTEAVFVCDTRHLITLGTSKSERLF